MAQLFRTAAITDEFSPDLDIALGSMAEVGMTGAELRMVFGKNIVDLGVAGEIRIQADPVIRGIEVNETLHCGVCQSQLEIPYVKLEFGDVLRKSH